MKAKRTENESFALLKLMGGAPYKNGSGEACIAAGPVWNLIAKSTHCFKYVGANTFLEIYELIQEIDNESKSQP